MLIYDKRCFFVHFVSSHVPQEILVGLAMHLSVSNFLHRYYVPSFDTLTKKISVQE